MAPQHHMAYSFEMFTLWERFYFGGFVKFTLFLVLIS